MGEAFGANAFLKQTVMWSTRYRRCARDAGSHGHIIGSQTISLMGLRKEKNSEDVWTLGLDPSR